MALHRSSSSKNKKNTQKASNHSAVSKAKSQTHSNDASDPCKPDSQPVTLEANGDVKGKRAVKSPRAAKSAKSPKSKVSSPAAKSKMPKTEPAAAEVNSAEITESTVSCQSTEEGLRTRWNAVVEAQLAELRTLDNSVGSETQLLVDQDQPCSSAEYNLGRSRCLECLNVRSKLTDSSASSRAIPGAFCRFCAFRKLTFTDKGVPIATDKFRSSAEARPDELQLWTPWNDLNGVSASNNVRRNGNRADVIVNVVSRFERSDAVHVIAHAADEFFRQVALELHAVHLDDVAKQRVAARDACNAANESMSGFLRRLAVHAVWRTPVSECRELCDVCSTSLYNVHWFCARCGFVSCIRCFRSRLRQQQVAEVLPDNASAPSNLAKRRKSVARLTVKRRAKKAKRESESSEETHVVETSGPFEHTWPLCVHSHRAHLPDSMKLAQLAPANLVWLLAKLLFDEAERFNVCVVKDFKRKFPDVDNDKLLVQFLYTYGSCEQR